MGIIKPLPPPEYLRISCKTHRATILLFRGALSKRAAQGQCGPFSRLLKNGDFQAAQKDLRGKAIERTLRQVSGQSAVSI
ncbi:MAG: hypothetical protein ACREX3_17235, partial [Gammaproteobacteria bacterium]